jgi:hypothetical protein
VRRRPGTASEEHRVHLAAIRTDLAAIAEVVPPLHEPLSLAAALLTAALDVDGGAENNLMALRDAALNARNLLRSLPPAAPWVHRLGNLIPTMARAAGRPTLRILR